MKQIQHVAHGHFYGVSAPSVVAAAVARVYTTLDPAKKGANISLSNGNLTATETSAAGTVLSIIGVASGKAYWEYIPNVVTGIHFMGVAAVGFDTSTFLGAQASGWAYRNDNGNKYNNASSTAYGSTWTTNDVIGIAVDADARTVTFYKNNVSQGSITLTGLTGTVYAAVGTNGGGISGTFNFGATPFVYTPPVGYNSGLYT